MEWNPTVNTEAHFVQKTAFSELPQTYMKDFLTSQEMSREWQGVTTQRPHTTFGQQIWLPSVPLHMAFKTVFEKQICTSAPLPQVQFPQEDRKAGFAGCRL